MKITKEEKHIKACPYCGSKDVEISGLAANYRYAECSECGATGPVAIDDEEAARLWNEEYCIGHCAKYETETLAGAAMALRAAWYTLLYRIDEELGLSKRICKIISPMSNGCHRCLLRGWETVPSKRKMPYCKMNNQILASYDEIERPDWCPFTKEGGEK